MTPTDILKHATTTELIAELLTRTFDRSQQAAICSVIETETMNHELDTRRLSLDTYQAEQLLTESPMDEAALARWSAVWGPALANLGRVLTVIQKSKLDNTKKYAAYNKQPHSFADDLNVTSYNNFESKPWDIESFAPCTDPNVYRLLHAILGKTTELEELLQSFLASCCRVYTGQSSLAERGFPDIRTRTEVTMDCIDIVNIGEELGDDAWYNALIANVCDLTLQQIIHANNQKLVRGPNARYKQSFTPEAANNRDIPAEQEQLKRTIIDHRSFGVDPLTPEEEADLTLAQKVMIDDAKLSLYCTYCDHTGHTKNDCPQLAADTKESLEDLEVMLQPAFNPDGTPKKGFQ